MGPKLARPDNTKRTQPPEPASISQIHGDCLYVPGRMEGGLHVRYLLDTGASDNFLARTAFDHLPKVVRARLEADTTTASAANGGSIVIYGTLTLSCRLRGVPLSIPFRVANITEDAILGMGFFRQNRCQLDLDQGVLHIGDHSIQCVDRTGYPLSAKVQVRKQITIPASTEMQIPCHLTNCTARPIGLIENLPTDDRGFRTATTIVTTDERRRVTARCINPHPSPITLSAGSVIGTFSVLTDEQINATAADDSPPSPPHTPHANEVPAHLQDLYQQASSNCDTNQRDRLAALLVQYADVFSAHEADVGRTSLVKHSIPTLPGTRPIKQPPRRLGLEKDAEVERQVQDLVKKGMIEPAESAWSSPVVLVRKKDSTWRLCVDYRRLNEVTKQDAFPLPRIDDSLDALSGSVYFSTLDLVSGYWQVPLDEEAQDKSAFVTRGGLWKWKVLPFGLTSGPSTFERLMERALSGLQWKILLLYLDDVVVFSTDFDSHLQRLGVVLERLRSAQLKLKPSKCSLLQKEVKYLGHVVSQYGVATDPDKTAAIREWKVPKCQTELRTFLGFVGYYRRFCPEFATIAKPLHRLTAKGATFTWGREEQTAYDKLRQSMLTAPVLAYPQPGQEFILDTDASLHGVGAVLSQVQDGQEKVISYFSKTLSPAEQNYCVTRRELLAVVLGVKHFRPYLYGRTFKLRTDHASLRWLYRLKEPHHQVARWLEILSEFRFQLQHRPGKEHENADALSRLCADCKQCQSISARDKETVEETTEVSVQHISFQDPLSNEVARLQDEKGSSTQVIREAILSGQPVPDHLVEQGSWELKQLANMMDLCELYKGILRIRLKNGQRTRWVTICPTALRQTVIQDIHTQHHSGINRTYRRLLTQWYWPGIHAAVRQAVKQCEVCQMAKHSHSSSSSHQQRLHSGRPWQVLAVDLVGPFTETPRGNRMVLVLTDHFSRWRDAIPIPDGTAETVARTLDERVFAYFGLPERIHTDQGAQFESVLFQELCGLWGVQKSRTTAYHPQGNGVVERGNKELGDGLRALLLHRAEEDWDLLLPHLMRSIRATPHSTTHETANFLMFGRELKVPGMLTQPNLEPKQTRTEYVAHMQERLQEAYEQLRDRQLATRTADEKSEPVYSVGDQVWLKNFRFKKGTTPKLQPKFTGPYVIEEVRGNRTYRVSCKGKTSVENEDRLKLYSPTTAGWGQAPQTTEITRQPLRPGPKKKKKRNSFIPEEPMRTETKRDPVVQPETPVESTVPEASLQVDPEPANSPPPEAEGSGTPMPSDPEPLAGGRPKRDRIPKQYPDFVLYAIFDGISSSRESIRTECTGRSASLLPTLPYEMDALEVKLSDQEVQDLRKQLEMSDSDNENPKQPAAEPKTPTPPKATKARPILSRIERSTDARLPCSASKFKYVHQETERVVGIVYEGLKATGQCQVCKKEISTGNGQKSRHAWDHFVIHLCGCGEFYRSYEESNTHRRYDHKEQTTECQKVCALLYQEVRDVFPTYDLPSTYPGERQEYTAIIPPPPTRAEVVNKARATKRVRSPPPPDVEPTAAPAAEEIPPQIIPRIRAPQGTAPRPEARAILRDQTSRINRTVQLLDHPPPPKRRGAIQARLAPRPAVRCNLIRAEPAPTPPRSPATRYVNVSTPEVLVRLQKENENLSYLEQMLAQSRRTSRELLHELSTRNQAPAVALGGGNVVN